MKYLNYKETYLTEEGVEFEYTICDCCGDYDTPGSHHLEIDKIIFEGKDVTYLLFDIADVYVYNIAQKIEQEEIEK